MASEMRRFHLFLVLVLVLAAIGCTLKSDDFGVKKPTRTLEMLSPSEQEARYNALDAMKEYLGLDVGVEDFSNATYAGIGVNLRILASGFVDGKPFKFQYIKIDDPSWYKEKYITYTFSTNDDELMKRASDYFCANHAKNYSCSNFTRFNEKGGNITFAFDYMWRVFPHEWDSGEETMFPEEGFN